jgi:thiol-disulfide isomerase/thioredoxin
MLITLVVGLGASKGPGQGELSAQQILTRSAENYRGVTGYAFSGSVATRMSVQGQVQNIDNTLLLAYGGPGRSRFEADARGDRTVMITSGESTWTYSSTLAQYMVQHVTAKPTSGLPAIDPQASHPMAGYARLAEHILTASLVGRDTATVNGKVVPTYVVDVRYDSTVVPASTGTAQATKRLAIDTERFLVVGDASSVERTHPSLPQPIRIEQSARFTDISWNTAQPDSLFAFVPPAGVIRVDQIGETGTEAEEASAYTGKAAPEFTLADLKGGKRALSSHKGKIVLLDFWATWCGPCRREMPIIAKMHERYASKGLVVYGVNCSESNSKAQGFVDKYGYKFPILLDRTGDVQSKYGITAIPTVFIVDKSGKVSSHLIGGRSEDDIVAALKKAGLDTGP